MRVHLAALLIGCVVSSTSLAQTFTTTTEIVTVPVNVTNRARNEPVEDLTGRDFRVYEDGVEQTVTLMTRERRAVSLCVVLDSSNSMRGNKQQVAAATVQRVLEGLDPRTR